MNDPAPYRDYLRPRGLTWIKTTLRVTVAVQCLGAAAQRLSAGTVSPVAEFLIVDVQWPEAQAWQLDNGIAYGLMVAGILIALRPSWPVLLPVTVWFIATAVVPLVRSVSPTSVIEFVAVGLRYLSPLSLMILDFWPPRLKSHLGRTVVAMWMLRLAATATFFGTGLLAILHSVEPGPSLALFQEVANQLRGAPLSNIVARTGLGAVGGLFMALALNMLVTRSKPVLVGAMAMGFVSAFSRMVESGPAGYPETLVRFAQIGAPLVLLLYFSLSIREFPPEVVPEN